MAEVLRAEDLKVQYQTKKGDVQAVNGVSFGAFSARCHEWTGPTPAHIPSTGIHPT